jgi:hypothetical protein
VGVIVGSLVGFDVGFDVGTLVGFEVPTVTRRSILVGDPLFKSQLS